MKIKVLKDGPYLVTGNIPLYKITIKRINGNYFYSRKKKITNNETYLLCRCRKSKNMPFCDNEHLNKFIGTLTTEELETKIYENDLFILKDTEKLCAYARLCHSKDSDVWKETNNGNKKGAIKLSISCPSGRLELFDKNSNYYIEKKYKPSIVLLEDPLNNCSGPIWVRGNIKIIDDKNKILKKNNRVTLCRCGESKIKPFCDSTHIDIRFNRKDNNDI